MSTQGRTIALFPGAFRPPHAAHFAAVLDLAQRPEMDEVVIIIANRNRTLPGTTLALDATIAQEIWALYLDAVDQYPALAKVRTESAQHSAIQHAVAYLDDTRPGDTLHYCIGERDLQQGDERFANLAEGAAQRGVCALITPAPTGDFAIRATDLRNCLTAGAGGRTEFMAALPNHLSTAQKGAVWERCGAGLCDITELLRDKVRTILQENRVATEPSLKIVKTGKLDPVFRLQQPDGRRLYIKYAGDTVEVGSVGDPLQAKPRHRLGTERRALTYLHKALSENREKGRVALPEIVLFDKATRTLVLSEVCPGGHALQEELAHGHFDPSVAAAAGRFLARAHTPTTALRPFWGEAETDLAHWRSMLALRTVEIDCAALPAALHGHLVRLQAWSDAARRPGFFHLDFVPKNIRIEVGSKSMGEIGMIDCELCANVGDPAYELGLLLSHYLFWAIVLERPEQGQSATQSLIEHYCQHSSAKWSTLLDRTTAFRGAGLLFMLASGPKVTTDIHHRFVATAATLLAQGLSTAGPSSSVSAF